MCTGLECSSEHTIGSDADIDYVAAESPEDFVHLLPAAAGGHKQRKAERKERGRSDNQDSWTSKEPNSQVMPTDPPLPPPPPSTLLVLKPGREGSQ